MNYARFKSLTIITVVVLSSAVLLSWSQNWFTFQGSVSPSNNEVIATGQVAAPALSALALMNFAIVAVISLANKLMRKILSILIVLSGSLIVAVSVFALSDPVIASQEVLTSASGLSNTDALREIISEITVTPWLYVSPISGLLLVGVGIVSFFTSAKWVESSKKYNKSRSSSPNRVSISRSSKNIDQWDALSSGEDPTKP